MKGLEWYRKKYHSSVSCTYMVIWRQDLKRLIRRCTGILYISNEPWYVHSCIPSHGSILEREFFADEDRFNGMCWRPLKSALVLILVFVQRCFFRACEYEGTYWRCARHWRILDMFVSQWFVDDEWTAHALSTALVFAPVSSKCRESPSFVHVHRDIATLPMHHCF